MELGGPSVAFSAVPSTAMTSSYNKFSYEAAMATSTASMWFQRIWTGLSHIWTGPAKTNSQSDGLSAGGVNGPSKPDGAAPDVNVGVVG